MPVLTFKVTPEQARKVRRAARLKNLTLSDYLRRVALPETGTASPPKVGGRPGRVIIGHAPDAPRLTKEIIDAALYD